MAEWAILILVCVVVGGAYCLNRRFFETWQIVAIWCGAGLILTIGLISTFPPKSTGRPAAGKIAIRSKSRRGRLPFARPFAIIRRLDKASAGLSPVRFVAEDPGISGYVVQ